MIVPQARIERDGEVTAYEIGELRASVGWDRAEDGYRRALAKRYARYTARSADGSLAGFLSVISDGVVDAFLLDLAVAPHYQRQGLGRRLVETAVSDARADGIRAVHVTFKSELAPFYARCGFHILGGGIIEFDE